MTARIDSIVKAIKPVTQTVLGAEPARDKDREARRRQQEERTARWKDISEAGGIDPWIAAQLKEKGLFGGGADPATLSDKEKGNYKTQKKAEAQERRKLRRLAWEAYHATHIVHLGAGVHWEDDPDVDKLDIEHRAERARDNGLPDLKGADEVAAALGLSISRLRWLTYHREVDSGSHYRAFTIPKRDGSPRLIWAPKGEIKAAQRWTLRHVAEKLPVHSAAHGFLANRSIATNAAVHAGADTVVKLDIKGFFPTVTFPRVKGLLRKAGLTESAATLLGLLCTEAPRERVTFRGKTLHVATGPRCLPQGAPTSPAITNALCMRLDRRLSGLSRTFGFRYTRYADDLTFSYHPPADAGPYPKAPVGALLRGVKQIVEAEGFTVHPEKTRVVRAGERQRVTGLVVNQAPAGVPTARVPRDVLRRLRAALHNREKGKPGKEGETLAQLKGMAAFVHMTDPKRGRELLDRVAALEAREG